MKRNLEGNRSRVSHTFGIKLNWVLEQPKLTLYLHSHFTLSCLYVYCNISIQSSELWHRCVADTQNIQQQLAAVLLILKLLNWISKIHNFGKPEQFFMMHVLAKMVLWLLWLTGLDICTFMFESFDQSAQTWSAKYTYISWITSLLTLTPQNLHSESCWAAGHPHDQPNIYIYIYIYIMISQKNIYVLNN